MAKSKDELLVMLRNNFMRDNTITKNGMSWRTVFQAAFDSLEDKRFKMAKGYFADLSLAELLDSKDLVEDLFIEEFLVKLEKHLAGIAAMSQAELESYQDEINEMVSVTKFDTFLDKQAALLTRFSEVSAEPITVMEEEVAAPVLPNKRKKKNESKN